MNKLHLPDHWYRLYLIARGMLWLTFIGLGILFSLKALFPSIPFTFDFENPSAQKNTLINATELGFAVDKDGIVPAGQPTFLHASLVDGDYSLIRTSFIVDTKQNTKAKLLSQPSGHVDVWRSQSVFFLPEGEPITEAAPAIEPDHYRSGALIAFADGVFVIDKNQYRPIGDATIFQNLGYSWDDVVKGDEETLGFYERGKMMLIDTPHPDGTVLHATDTDRYFLIRENQKHLIPDTEIAKTYLYGTHPIPVLEQSLSVKASCAFRLTGWFEKHLDCDIPATELASMQGATYRFSLNLDSDTALKTSNIIFTDAKNIDNLKKSLSLFKQRILLHFGYDNTL